MAPKWGHFSLYKGQFKYILSKNRLKMQLKLKHNISNSEYNFWVTDGKSSQLFYSCDINLLSNMQDGEYTYELYENNGEFLATGLLQIGEYIQAPANEYNGTKKNLIVYGK